MTEKFAGRKFEQHDGRNVRARDVINRATSAVNAELTAPYSAYITGLSIELLQGIVYRLGSEAFLRP